MGDAYRELVAQKDLIKKVIKEEEESFLRTLDKGIGLLDNLVAAARKEGKTEISGKDAFTLYDTYGFPLDLTELILREQGMTLDHKGYEEEMDRQKQRARNAAAIETGDWVVLKDGEQKFVGYDAVENECRILRYRKVKQKGKEFFQIILDETPFYGEMGGQVGDKGKLIDSNGEEIEIFDTKRENNVSVHLSYKLPENPADVFKAVIDTDARAAISANHSATHLIHEALREVLGTHVEQKGSYVSPDSLRFDFSHFQKVTPEEIRKVEHIVNARIRKAMPLDEHREMPIAEAKALGAMALFGEKYGDKVRVVKFGDSVELCGGTHVANTGNIGMVRIVSESSIAAGIRRIEAVSGAGVEKVIDDFQDLTVGLAELLGASGNLRVSVEKALKENADLRKQVEEAMAERIESLASELVQNAKEVNGVKVIELVGVRLPDMVKNVAFSIRKKLPEHVAFVGATVSPDKKPLLTVMLSDDLVKGGANAGQIVREAAKLIKGGGGGQPFFAQAGGKDPEGLSAARDRIIELLAL
ncbi:MAG: alanine--tRNA ligase, partial [Muribaculaceae bacterium]|nr:alanine--tRNA ligase [Muribaculaceae bacterium]